MIQCLLIWSVLVAVPQRDVPSRVIASTKEWKITAGEFQQILATFPQDARQRFSIAANRRNLMNEVIRIWVLSTEARKNGTSVGTTYQARRDYYVQYAQQLGTRITDDRLRGYYKQHLADYERVRLSHILILNGGSPIIPPNIDPKKARLPYDAAFKKAQEIRAMLAKGAKFEDLAKQYSEDPTSAAHSGEFGTIARGQIDKNLEAVAFRLKAGEFSEVVGSIYGFHILRVTEKKVPSFEELKDQIRQKLTADAINADIEPKVKAAGVTVDEAYFR
jgi:PPIC-type PPIASE domain